MNVMKFTRILYLIFFIIEPAKGNTTITGTGRVLEEVVRKQEQSLVSSRTFFHSYGPHPTPLLYCNSKTRGSYFRLPVVPSCEFKKYNSNAIPKPVRLTTWIDNPEDQLIYGYNCWAVKKCRWQYYRWTLEYSWGACPEKPHQITESDCRKMLNEEMTPNGEKMKFMGDGLYAYIGDPDPGYTYLTKNVANWEDYFLQQYRVSVDTETHVINSMVPLIKDCKIMTEVCPTSQLGFLIWDRKHFNPCNLLEESTDTCYFLEDTITCPDRQIVLTQLKSIEVCAMNFGYSAQKVVFTLEDSLSELDLVKTSDLRQLVGKKSRLQKRGITTLASQSIVNAGFQYVQAITLENLSRIQETLCFMHQEDVRNGIKDAMDGNPGKLIETVLGPGLRGSMFGHVLLVWECEKIVKYRFLKASETDCTEEWPTEFILQNGTTLMGYLGTSMELFLNPTVSDCPQRDYYFQSGKYSYPLKTRSYEAFRTFPQLPLAGNNNFALGFINITFNEAGAIALKDASKKGSQRELMRDISRITRSVDEMSNWSPEEGPPHSEVILNAVKYIYNQFALWIYIIVGVLGLLVVIRVLSCVIGKKQKKSIVKGLCCKNNDKEQENNLERIVVEPSVSEKDVEKIENVPNNLNKPRLYPTLVHMDEDEFEFNMRR